MLSEAWGNPRFRFRGDFVILRRYLLAGRPFLSR